MRMKNDHSHEEGFKNEKEIEDLIKGTRKGGAISDKEPFSEWVKANNDHGFTIGHMKTIGESKFTCNTLTDEWFRWFLSTPAPENAMTNPANAYGSRNVSLMDKELARVYFAAASPFQEPFDFRRIVMTKKAPLLVPAYNMVASIQEYPFEVNGEKEKAEKLSSIVEADLNGILTDSVEAYLDGAAFYGCCVIRKELITISNIPDNNVLGIPQERLEESGHSIECVHGGLWMLLNEEHLGHGDHLLQFKAHSKNYQIQAKFLIKVQY